MTDIAIRLPLPMSVSATLMNLVGTAWPEAELVNDKGGHFTGDRYMVLRVPDAPAREVSVDEAAGTLIEPGEDDVDVLELGPGSIAVRSPEQLNATILEIMLAGFEENPSAVNYLENHVRDPKTGDEYVLIFARSKGQTPHELRLAAEARADAVHANVHREVVEQLMTLQGRQQAGSYADGVRAALETVRQLNFSRIA